ncbi:MAG: alpha/beta hydrolase [Alphaproteobacteria bacterium]|nr:alpha/beta hydrolase [Alphaproteobacteria bacterium]MBV9693284.1 alpha/beta hydrolase [Alphaproteobacteria bacterium]
MSIAREFVGLPSPKLARAGAGGHPCQGLYWTKEGTRPRVALIATHYNVDFAEHYSAPYFAARGFGFLGWNTRYRGAEDLFHLEHAIADIGVGVRWLREQGVQTVVLLGNSGGGSLMAAYQAEAADKGDLYISLNAHPGRPEVLTKWMDPSVIDETDPVATDAALDPFNAASGPPFSNEFIARYRAAQVARNLRITRWAQDELKRLNAARIPDRIFPLFRTWADLRFIDPAIEPTERPCPGCYAGAPNFANRGPFGIGRTSSLRAWLSMWSLETSRCQGPPQLAKLDVPALVVQSTADMGVFPSDARKIHDSIASTDKTLTFLAGAHYFEDSEAHREAAIDLMADWIRERT